MSPEQLLARRVDLRSDIFSFGIVLYEMLTRQHPFACDNDIDTMHAILHEEARPPHAVKYDLPRELEAIMAKALAKTPKLRYQTVNPLVADLKTVKRDVELGRPSARAKTKLVLKPVTAAARAEDRLREGIE